MPLRINHIERRGFKGSPEKLLDLLEAVVDIAELWEDTPDERAHIGAAPLRADTVAAPSETGTAGPGECIIVFALRLRGNTSKSPSPHEISKFTAPVS